MRKWLQPGKTPYLVITIFILVMSVVMFATQSSIEGGIACAVFGVTALLVHLKAKKKNSENQDKQ